jgi:hypothetical protein
MSSSGLQKLSLKRRMRATILEIRPVPILLGSMQHQLTPFAAGADCFKAMPRASESRSGCLTKRGGARSAGRTW